MNSITGTNIETTMQIMIFFFYKSDVLKIFCFFSENKLC
jgi:hypothetical protein